MDDDLRDILGHVVKHGGFGFPDPSNLADRGHATYAKACEALVDSLLEGADLNYVRH